MSFIVSVLDRIRKGGKQLLDLLRTVPTAARRYGRGPVWTFARGLELVRGGWFSAEEAFELGLFDPGVEPETAGYVAKQRLTVLQDGLNPWAPRQLVRDKALFYRYCAAVGIPTPRLLAVWYRDACGWTWKGRLLGDTTAWEAFLYNELPDEFVVKPARGHHGRHVRIFRRDSNMLVDHTDTALSPRRLLENLREHADHDSFVFQERALGHAALRELSGSTALQTVRVITLAVGKDEVESLMAVLKLGGDGAVDNFNLGRTGGLFAEVELASGRLVRAWGAAGNPPGLSALTRHPVTESELSGFIVPHWTEMLALVERSARAFLPLRTLGWDVGITADGPLIIEANAWWDPLPFPGMVEIARRLVDAVEEPISAARP